MTRYYIEIWVTDDAMNERRCVWPLLFRSHADAWNYAIRHGAARRRSFPWVLRISVNHTTVATTRRPNFIGA